LCRYDKKVYAFGGVDKNDTIHDYCEFYSIE
jgi:hypothetical protein